MVIALNQEKEEIQQYVQHMLWDLQVSCCVANQKNNNRKNFKTCIDRNLMIQHKAVCNNNL